MISELLKRRDDDEQNRQRLEALGAVYKQLNASFGSFAMDILVASTRALSGDDATYTRVEAAIADVTARRDALAAQIRSALNAAAFAGKKVSTKQAKDFTSSATALLNEAADLTIP